MKKLVAILLMVALFGVFPGTSFSQDGQADQATTDTHTPDGKTTTGGTGTGMEVGIVATAVSILGLIALAASTDSGNATPATTTHPH